MNANNPLFIIGNPRSGTTMLRLILTSHSKVLVPPECGFIIWLKDKYANWEQKDNDIRNFHINYLGDLLGLYGEARFLHIVRDGRDVACSYREVMSKNSTSPYAPKLNTVVYDIAKEWFINVMRVDSFMNMMPSNQVMTVRYEDLVKNSSETVELICHWLGLNFESDMFNFHLKNRDKKLEPELTMDWKERTMQPISDETIGRHKTLLTNDELIQFAAIADQALSKFNYK